MKRSFEEYCPRHQRRLKKKLSVDVAKNNENIDASQLEVTESKS